MNEQEQKELLLRMLEISRLLMAFAKNSPVQLGKRPPDAAVTASRITEIVLENKMHNWKTEAKNLLPEDENTALYDLSDVFALSPGLKKAITDQMQCFRVAQDIYESMVTQKVPVNNRITIACTLVALTHVALDLFSDEAQKEKREEATINKLRELFVISGEIRNAIISIQALRCDLLQATWAPNGQIKQMTEEQKEALRNALNQLAPTWSEEFKYKASQGTLQETRKYIAEFDPLPISLIEPCGDGLL